MIELPRKEIFDNLLKNEASQNTREKKIRLFVTTKYLGLNFAICLQILL